MTAVGIDWKHWGAKYEAGMTLRQIAARLPVTYEEVLVGLEPWVVFRSDPKPSPPAATADTHGFNAHTVDWMVGVYVNQEASIHTIADAIGKAESRVEAALLSRGVRLRVPKSPAASHQ